MERAGGYKVGGKFKQILATDPPTELLINIVQILKFDGGETSAVKYLSRDSSGNHVSSLVIEDIQMGDSGEFTCQPAAGAAARVLVHVLQRETEVQAVLGEGNLLKW